jgi:hypothetical protein
VNNGIDNANHDRNAALILYPTLDPGSPIPNLCDPYGPAPDYPAATCPAGQGTLGNFRNVSAYARYDPWAFCKLWAILQAVGALQVVGDLQVVGVVQVVGDWQVVDDLALCLDRKRVFAVEFVPGSLSR